METVEAGWNILAGIEDKDFREVIEGFEPDGERPELYGRDVAERMVFEIGEFF